MASMKAGWRRSTGCKAVSHPSLGPGLWWRGRAGAGRDLLAHAEFSQPFVDGVATEAEVTCGL